MDAATSWLASQVRLMMKQMDEMSRKIHHLEKSMNKHEEDRKELSPDAAEFVPLDRLLELCKGRHSIGQDKLQETVVKLMGNFVQYQATTSEGFQTIVQKVETLYKAIMQKVETLHNIVRKKENEAQDVNDEIRQSSEENVWMQKQCKAWEDGQVHFEDIEEESELLGSSSTWSRGCSSFLGTMDWRTISGVSTHHYSMATQWLRAMEEHDYESDSNG